MSDTEARIGSRTLRHNLEAKLFHQETKNLLTKVNCETEN